MGIDPHPRRGAPGARHVGWATAAGVVGVAVGVLAGELTAGLLSPSVSPVSAVGSAVIDGLPPGVKDAAISLFGTNDKLVFLLAMVLVILLLAAAAGVLELHRRRAGSAVVLLFGALGLLAVVTRAQSSPPAWAAPIVAGVLGAWLLPLLIQPLAAWRAGEERSGAERGARGHRDADAGRRRFLQGLGAGAAVAVVAALVTSAVRIGTAGVAALRQGIRLPAPSSPARPLPAPTAVPVPGVTPLVTSNADFYRIDTALVVPVVDPRTWRLRVTGLIEQEIELDLAQLLAKPMVERYVTLACVSNDVGGNLVGNARWLGWPVADLLAAARPRSSADMVLSRSTDGFTAGTPLEVLTDGRDALLAVGMNGEPLPVEHGFPARLVVPGLYGYVSATKWVTELKVTRFADDAAYWSTRGWSVRGPVKTASRIDVPRGGRAVKAGRIAVGGVAWAQHRGISAVQVRINKGPWIDAGLGARISADTWCQWSCVLDLGPGRYELQVRAVDGAGSAQDETPRAPAPDGATGFHTIELIVA